MSLVEVRGRVPPILLPYPNWVLICESLFYSCLWDSFFESSVTADSDKSSLHLSPNLHGQKALFAHQTHSVSSILHKTEILIGCATALPGGRINLKAINHQNLFWRYIPGTHTNKKNTSNQLHTLTAWHLTAPTTTLNQFGLKWIFTQQCRSW